LQVGIEDADTSIYHRWVRNVLVLESGSFRWFQIFNSVPSPTSRYDFLLMTFPSVQSVGRLDLLVVIASTVIPGISLLEIHDQDLYFCLDMYMFRSRAASSTRGGVSLSV
jgi:hypothetical protein